ncbi:uncharacterized protein LOC129590843 isoform X2 [Paramacrobiotus metropolitanus]|uniref:uncharacterized protein LOC129590843 isoform X2 n=1 Tax=Paramacrobiotus metropolitanus TaxID=2943436 RepID=UPI0024462014|nr:uncharacterized protein LOC129590843 isoform X2 [Paramacrobiotus metropolitanus]
MSRYHPLLTDSSQISYRNTVAVRNLDDTWWLGYIQNIEGNRAFVHFDCKTVEARWMPMKDVWPLPSYWDTVVSSEGYINIPIFAALRDNDKGPLRFRPAVMINRLLACNVECEMFCIRTDGCSSRFEVVHKDQVATELPPSPPRQGWGLLYTKHFVPFGQAIAVLSDPSDKFRIIKHVRDAIEARMELTRTYIRNCCRFHLRIESERCMFIVISRDNGAESTYWSETLLKILETHLAGRNNLPPIHKPALVLQASANISYEAEGGVDALMPNHLTPSLVSDILSHLDLHSQMKAKRVCALWELLLSNSRMKEHVSISFESCWNLKMDTDNCFKAASLLSRSISSTTISLTLLRVFPPIYIHSEFIGAMFDAIKIKLPLLVLKDHNEVAPECFGQKRSYLKHGAAWNMTLYKHTCDSVVLRNWTVSDLFGRHMFKVFVIQSTLPDGVYLPEHEQKWMVPYKWQPEHMTSIDKLQITIPKLLLPCSEGKLRMTSRVMCALNDNFPLVTEEMLIKVTAVHARWLRTLVYPEDWRTIRHYLMLFSGFHSDGSPKEWDEVDLRVVDVSTWSKLAIYGINEMFRV